MPFANFHSARIRQPGGFLRIRQIEEAEGGSIRFIGGPLKTDPKAAVVQAIRFETDKFTVAQARKWLSEHEEFKVIEFEEAKKEDSADGPLIGEGEVLRFDHTSAGKVVRTNEGYMMADAVITKAGVFSYRMPDGQVRHELRPPDEVFHADSMKTAEMLPITNDHPYSSGGYVCAKNAKQLAVGYTGQKVRQDAMNLRAPVKITTEEGVKAIEAGQRELSLGYKCRVVREDGVWEGKPYTHKQVRIRYNHLALVQQARAGHDATLRLDGADAVMVIPDTGKEPTTMGDKVRLDNGIEYDCAPEVAVAFEKLRKDHSELQSTLASGTKATDELQGKHDALDAKVKELEKRDDSAEVQKRVKARIALQTAAAKRLPKETVEKLDTMSDEDIRKAVILAKTPKAELEGKSDEYIQARFDTICDEPEEKRDDGQGRVVVGEGKPTKPVDADQARLDGIERARLRSLGIEEKKSA